MNTLVTTLFQSRIYSHYHHLLTKSYAEHKTLEEYYDGIVDLVDDLVEIHCKMERKISMPKSIDIPSFNPVEYFTGLSGYVKEQIPTMEDEALKNKLTEILELINKTLYRLSLR